MGGEHTTRYTDDVLQNCALEIYMMLLTNVAPINLKKKGPCLRQAEELSSPTGEWGAGSRTLPPLLGLPAQGPSLPEHPGTDFSLGGTPPCTPDARSGHVQRGGRCWGPAGPGSVRPPRSQGSHLQGTRVTPLRPSSYRLQWTAPPCCILHVAQRRPPVEPGPEAAGAMASSPLGS